MRRPGPDAPLRTVPAAAIGLPWIRFPRDGKTCAAIVTSCDAQLARRDLSEPERDFWTSVAAHIAALAARAQAHADADASRPRRPRERDAKLSGSIVA